MPLMSGFSPPPLGPQFVATNAAIAGALSTITEIPDVAAAVKTPRVDLGTPGKEAADQALKTTDVDTSLIKNTTDGADGSIAKETASSIGTKLKEKYHRCSMGKR